MKKTLLAILIIVIASILIYQNQNNPNTHNSSDSKIIKIGVIAPFSGDNAIIGQTFKNGFDFAQKHLKTKLKFEFIFEDDQMQSVKTNSAALKLATVDKVDAIFTSASQAGSIVAPIAAKHNIIQFASSSESEFTKFKNNYAFAPNPKDDARVLLSFIEKKGFKKIALLSANETFGNLAENNIKSAIKETELKLVFNAKFNENEKDFRLLINKAENENPDIYIIQSWEPALDIAVTQLKQIAPGKPFTTEYGFVYSNNLNLFNGQFFLNIGASDDTFNQEYLKEYSKYPDQMATVAYAMTALFLNTFEEIQKSNDKDFNIAMQKTAKNKPSIFGKLTTNGGQINYLSVLQEIKDGQPIPIK